jgi:hypothetical protein
MEAVVVEAVVVEAAVEAVVVEAVDLEMVTSHCLLRSDPLLWRREEGIWELVREYGIESSSILFHLNASPTA